jgi:hypothetical protein
MLPVELLLELVASLVLPELDVLPLVLLLESLELVELLVPESLELL